MTSVRHRNLESKSGASTLTKSNESPEQGDTPTKRTDHVQRVPSYETWLSRPVNNLNLVIFRIFFGFMMCFHIYRLMYWQTTLPTTFDFAELNFRFWFAPVVPQPSLTVLRWVYLVCCVSAFCVGLGLFYRASCFIFLLTYTYQNLLEKSRYNNHFYLYVLLAFFFLISDAAKRLSVDCFLKQLLSTRSDPPDADPRTAPFWQVFLFKFQLFVVYFYAGIAKLNYDWAIRGEPMRTWGYHTRFPLLREGFEFVLPPDLVQDVIGYFYSIGGLMFDLLVGFFLITPRLRLTGIIFSLGFHGANHFLFKIGTFPWLMIGSNVIYLEENSVENLFQAIKKKVYNSFTNNISKMETKSKENPPVPQGRLSKPIKWLLMMFVATQLLLPFRHWLYPGNVNWTLEGHQFSWRMMLNEEEVIMRFHIRQRGTGDETVFEPYQRYTNNTVDLTLVNHWAFTHDWVAPQMSDDVIDFHDLREVKREWDQRGFGTSFFMDRPGSTHKTSFQRMFCEDMRAFGLKGTLQVMTDNESRSMRAGDSATVPSHGPHSVTCTGNLTCIWYYVYDCDLASFQQAQKYLGVQGWKFKVPSF
ncbi:predicted protein [Nematostella vectensis]|uniref:Vitamin K-dependent gamma-carboxylase n=1 Tax=Nematostella vectensis TaxID=45351 RepID=A7S4D4_NEMVE|nr:predicted protein [Nematostella vectensis]|eukprot:XP_001633518.1 predicted protein [Nematostella vectensis]